MTTCGIEAAVSLRRAALPVPHADRRTAPNLPKVRSRAVSEESDVWVFSLSCRCVRPAWPSPAVRLSPALRFVRGGETRRPTGSGSGCRIFPTPFGGAARAEYLALHYWDGFDFAGADIAAPEAEQAFVDFLGLLSRIASADGAFGALSGARLVPTGCTV